ncbi:MAG: phosphatidate cytidylyltransferase [Bacteroidales bacterium]|nr:phosphatidate cytidylyltransferase [Bacteroidales bacterium]
MKYNLNNINDIHALLIMGGVFVVIIGVAEILKRKLKVKSEYSRKFIHIAIGMVCVLAPFRIMNHWYVLTLTGIFILFLFNDRKVKYISSLQVNRKSHGDILLPITIYLNYLLFRYYGFHPVFYLPLLILSISDPAAYFGGELFNKSKKSLPGSISFFITALIATWILFSICNLQPASHKILLTLSCAVLGTLVESISLKGWDNITLPITLGVILIIYFEYIAQYGIN